MALLFFDGFDHLGLGDPATLQKWGSSAGAGSPANSGLVRTGTHAVRFTTGGFLISKAFTPSGGAVVGFAVQAPTFAAADILQVREGTTVHVALAVTATGLLEVKRGTTVLATGLTPLLINTWHYLELQTVIHDSTGSYAVRVDGVPVAELTASGVDTRNAGTGLWDRIRLGPTSTVTVVDDFYLADTSGPAPRNTFLGPVKVETLYPQTDAVAAGSNAGLTPSTGTDHGAMVDETTPNTTDYNSSATVGAKDTYNYPSPALTGAVLGIQANLYVQKSDAAARQVCAVVRAGGVDYDGASVPTPTTFSYLSEVRAQNPNTGVDWTLADLATVQAGMKVTV